MPGPITSDDLLSQVRQQIDEANTDDISDSDVLAALNRGQRKACSILARKFPDFFISPVSVTTTANVGEYNTPQESYGRRINQVTVTLNGYEQPLTRVSYSQLARYHTPLGVAQPSVYAIVGRQYYLRPTPAQSCDLTLWITKAPETLVPVLGRVTSVSVASSYVLLDSIASLSTDASNLAAFVNIVDCLSGEIKATLQVSQLTTATKRVDFKTSGLTLPTVYNRTVGVAIPATVAVNDYVCAVQGTAVSDLPDACVDYLVQYAVTEVRRRFQEDVQAETLALKELETEIERQWVGRQQSARVANNSRAWSR